MMIPAMDAVVAKRVGYISNNNVQMATVMHDESVKERNNGGAWKNARPMAIVTDEPVDLAAVFQNVTDYTQNNFSPEFWEECAKVYRQTSTYEEGESNPVIDYPSIESDFEVKFLSSIIEVCERGEGFTHDVWSNIIQDSEWSHIEDNKTGDVNLYSEQEKTFEESVFTNQKYIPDPSEVDEWGLYDYSLTTENIDSQTIWVRFKFNDNIVEHPLVYDTDSRMFILSSSPDFGGMNSSHISDDVQKALENGVTRCRLTNMINETELCSKTKKYIRNATDSQPVEP